VYKIVRRQITASSDVSDIINSVH